MTPERALAWCLAWEVEGARQGQDRYDDYFWRDGGHWIDLQRGHRTAGRPPSTQ